MQYGMVCHRLRMLERAGAFEVIGNAGGAVVVLVADVDDEEYKEALGRSSIGARTASAPSL